ncbi:plasmid mobilization relaxosome protein MobC [Pimelobacter simplex]|uniref:plasmid mobilization relaxosome protein MobC n=2 Tax=Pimelobacter TaxID=2044 RepID=UPI00214FCED0|nr:plasmid mobilization relaxosome protein MobC [Pimelobacter simplex]UUW93001.1 plasmid mobilization relaxosome protein MobC [Pimelobacter simplex]UUW99034.1 plasmid mobilization relaxosome protein MobC [Pimelobacter simplex]
MASTMAEKSEEKTAGRTKTRRRRNQGGARPNRTVIRHTDEEWARVNAAASHLGLSVPGFYERAAFAGSAQAAVELSIIEDELFGVRRLLANAANNLNQVARSLNTDGSHEPAQLAGSLQLFEDTIARLNGLLDSLPGHGIQ